MLNNSLQNHLRSIDSVNDVLTLITYSVEKPSQNFFGMLTAIKSRSNERPRHAHRSLANRFSLFEFSVVCG